MLLIDNALYADSSPFKATDISFKNVFHNMEGEIFFFFFDGYKVKYFERLSFFFCN